MKYLNAFALHTSAATEADDTTSHAEFKKNEVGCKMAFYYKANHFVRSY